MLFTVESSYILKGGMINWEKTKRHCKKMLYQIHIHMVKLIIKNLTLFFKKEVQYQVRILIS
jgi:hypothetical protein